MNNYKFLLNTLSILFAILLFCIGIVNTFWGNDPSLGVGLLILSLLYLPPVTKFIQLKTGLNIPVWVKIILGLLLLWVALGVGELFGKIGLMIKDLS